MIPPATSPPAVRERSSTATQPEGRRRRVVRRKTSLFAHGEPMLWLTGGALVVALAMIAGLLALVVWQGATTFWPVPIVRLDTAAGPYQGEVSGRSTYAEGGLELGRTLLRTGNFDLTNTHYHWVRDDAVTSESRPGWALVVERLTWGRFYGTPAAFLIDGQEVADDPARIWELYEEYHGPSRERVDTRRRLEDVDVGRVNRGLEAARLRLREVELANGAGSPAWEAEQRNFAATEGEAEAEFERIRGQIDGLNEENRRYQLALETADGTRKPLVLAEVVRAYPANSLSWFSRLGIYLSRWWEFLTTEPREANTEGGVLPAVFGTVAMTLIMSIFVAPFGVLAALYLREYARQGAIISAVRIAVNNLAGVPSIVFGVFGLGFFCYIIGGGIDALFYETSLPNPTFGTGGLLWASLTLALLTLPVVIVATEEAISAVPSSMREGSYACGATKWQTVRRIVLPRAMPGIMTGMILAIARGAGEVAPLMLVGAVKLTDKLPFDSVDLSGSLAGLHTGPMHLDRKIMHLGFHIYDLGFQSPNSEAAKPMVYTTTLLLIAIIVLLNVLAIWIRSRLRRRFQGGHV